MKPINTLLTMTLASASALGLGFANQAEARTLVVCGPNAANYVAVEKIPLGCRVLKTGYGQPAVDYGDLGQPVSVETETTPDTEVMTEPDLETQRPNTAPDVSPSTPESALPATQEPQGAMPPLPETREQAVANVSLVNDQVDIQLTNNTNALITYEAIQYTQRRTLQPGETVTLQDLPAPVTVTAVRQDNGLLDISSVTTPEAGLLEVSLDESTDLDDTQGVLRVQESGQVFIN